MEETIQYRLKSAELVPVEMSQYRIGETSPTTIVYSLLISRVEDGRVFFTVPDKFETSLSLRGALKDDGWFFVHVEFLHSVGGELNDVQGQSNILLMQAPSVAELSYL